MGHFSYNCKLSGLPKDGEHKLVMKLLNISTEILNKELEERKEWEDDM